MQKSRFYKALRDVVRSPGYLVAIVIQDFTLKAFIGFKSTAISALLLRLFG